MCYLQQMSKQPEEQLLVGYGIVSVDAALCCREVAGPSGASSRGNSSSGLHQISLCCRGVAGTSVVVPDRTCMDRSKKNSATFELSAVRTASGHYRYM